MPELPEVETIRRQLNKVLAGQRIEALQGPTLQVEGKKILSVRRKAKMIIIELNGGKSLLIHLKMTGQLLYEKNNQFSIFNFQNKHTRVIITLEKGKLFFNDLRKFGWIRIVNNQELKDQLGKLPPDVVDKEFTVKYLEKVLKSSKIAIKLVLLDQAKLGGLGNIYVNESLFCARVNPSTPANQVRQIKELHNCIKKVINQAIKYGGTTSVDESFKNVLGKPGRFQEFLKVYENKGKCYKCRTKIIKIKIGGRGTYFCPKCQK